MLSPHGSIFQTWFLFHKVEVGCSILLWIWCFFWWVKKIYTKIHYWEINLILQISRDKFLEWYLAAMSLSSVKLLAHLNVVMPGSDVAWSTRLRNKDREVPKCNQSVVWLKIWLYEHVALYRHYITAGAQGFADSAMLQKIDKIRLLSKFSCS